MDYKEFIENVQSELAHHFTDAFKNIEVMPTEVDKFQGQSYSGIAICPEDSNVGISLNLENYFEDFNNGRSLNDILQSIAENAEHHLPDNVYHYDAVAKVLEQADKFEARQI